MDGSRSNWAENLLRIAAHTQVVHHIPGRIRLRILPSALKLVRGMDVDKTLGALPGIKGVRINAVVGSVVLEYDSSKLPYNLWEQLRQLRKKPQLEGDLRELLKRLGQENSRA